MTPEFGHGPDGADLARLRTLDGAKWSRYDDDVIPAWVADMDFAPAPIAVEAIRSVIDRGDVGYNHLARLDLAAAFADWQKVHHDWSPDPSECVLFNDVLHAIEYTIWHCTEPGDGIVLLTPIYPPFIHAVESSGRRIIDCPLDPVDWSFDPEVLERVIDDRTRVVLWCNPHNPTGRVFSADEMNGLADVVARHDLIVISDEVWGDLVYPGEKHRPVALGPSELASRTVTISAVSKSFNLAGLRSAVAHLGHPAIRERFLAHPDHLRGAVNTLGAEAALACWRSGLPWLDELRAHLLSQRDHLDARLAAELPAVRFLPPQGTYLAWLDFRALELGPSPSKKLLHEGRVALSPGPDFGPRGEGFARLNFATSRVILDEILDRMMACLTNS